MDTPISLQKYAGYQMYDILLRRPLSCLRNQVVFGVIPYTWYRKTKNLNPRLVLYLTYKHKIKPLISKRLHSGIERRQTKKADNMQQSATDEFPEGKQIKTQKKSLQKVIWIYKVFQNRESNMKEKNNQPTETSSTKTDLESLTHL